ncbi:TIGR04255 family protein [Synechococcales cyanobacterium C]|uniref:TIGR04255 family protein n=1 Tax=Petrachloros mirabilis ULC683 TaxID=2781853 RepID=A0A8K1ZYN6_9CYAN|nr:TIGR04255 family protein [Petrachloros mirabilis]NCJ07263.1 TIGR04255 family protein [Petrachloros mirabilis ULC683]
MSPLPKLSIDLTEPFPTLKDAPIIEAVIHWQAHAGKTLESEALRAELTQRLPDYPILHSLHGMEIAATGAADGSSALFHRTQWNGFRLQDEQNHHVAQFTPTGVVFSRLSPYAGWNSFQTEAIRFWTIFLELAEPTTIQRLGVRYIARISLENNEQPSHYLNTVPLAPPGLDLPTDSFFHQDTYQVPGYPYQINWVRTIQPAGADLADGRALITDIDVSTRELLQLREFDDLSALTP